MHFLRQLGYQGSSTHHLQAESSLPASVGADFLPDSAAIKVSETQARRPGGPWDLREESRRSQSSRPGLHGTSCFRARKSHSLLSWTLPCL